MWPSYLHQLALHFPIVLSLVLAGLGAWVVRRDSRDIWRVLRVVGAFAWSLTTVAAVTGLISASSVWTDEGPDVLIHHRNLGILGWVCATVAVGAVEYGVRKAEDKVAKFGALAWIAVALAMLGAGHWGGSGVHSDVVPWQGTPPVIRPATP